MLLFHGFLLFLTLWGMVNGGAGPPWPHKNHALRRRQSSSGGRCDIVKYATGGRAIGLVVDISSSMEDNDPNNLRFTAANFLNDALISSSEAASTNLSPDSIAVIFFWGESIVNYSLGDPAGAANALRSGPLRPSTFIGGGVKDAIDQLTQPRNSQPPNNSAIVIFTDGEDDPPSGITQTIAQINRAASLGIRVFLGFLVPDEPGVRKPAQDPRITVAVLRSGGQFTTIGSDLAQRSFVEQILRYGLTAGESTGITALYPGLNSTALVPAGRNSTFVISVTARERFNVTVTTPNNTALVATLHDETKNLDIQSQQTNTSNVAFLEHTAGDAGSFLLTVSAPNARVDDSLFSVYLQSSFGPTNQTVCIQNSTNITFHPSEGGRVRSLPSTAVVTIPATLLVVIIASLL